MRQFYQIQARHEDDHSEDQQKRTYQNKADRSRFGLAPSLGRNVRNATPQTQQQKRCFFTPIEVATHSLFSQNVINRIFSTFSSELVLI